ncbi:MetS family NSS transporter small subunit [Actinoplanes sp. NBC_00393]
MSTGAIIMLLIGAVGLWGTLALAVANYVRKSGLATPDVDESR